MKNSVAVFSNQGDPFPTQTRSRTPYHPSEAETLSEAQKQTVLSPDRLRSLPRHLSDALSPLDLGFLVGSQRLLPGLPETDSSEPFDESWPSTEGSSKTPEREEKTAASNSGRTDEPRVPACEESVLARYITRFRSGRPTSRRDRSPPRSGLKDFWWLQDSPESPEVMRLRPDAGSPVDSPPRALERTPTPHDSSENDSGLCPEDVDTAGLQLRARKLLQRSESSLSGADPVSSEGLGSSPGSNVSSFDYDGGQTRPPLLDAAPVAPVLRPNLPSIRAHPSPAPEEDILYQWRLRRKMEWAREGTLPFTTRKRSPSPPVRISRQVLRTDDSPDPVYQVPPPGAAQSSCVASQPHVPVSDLCHVPLASPIVTPTCNVPPHLHLLCDILPCVRSQKPRSAPRVPQAEVVSPAVRDGEGGALRAGHWQQHKAPPERQRKAERTEEKRVKPEDRDRSRRKRETMEAGREVTARSVAGAVHQAMGQVISERLFSPLPSSKPKSERREQRPPTPSTEDDADPQPAEIAAHLLEEAEDSDGTDFADDPLLQVLRYQRESLRSRLWAAESRLAELEKEEQDE